MDGNEGKTPSRMPVLFVGHGSPMNVIEDNRWSRGFAALRDLVPRPKAILAVSAHWYVRGSYVTVAERPETIHDFSGFPGELYEIVYPAPGDPALAGRVRALLGEDRVAPGSDWGLDHGTWSVLHHMFPEATIPVVQLSIDRRMDVAGHHEQARALAPLRDEGILIFCSGNVVHNLGDAIGRLRSGSTETPDWARRFDETVARMLMEGDTEGLLSLWPDGEDGALAHPIPDHWLPLIYADAVRREGDGVRFPASGFDLGSLSMRSVLFG